MRSISIVLVAPNVGLETVLDANLLAAFAAYCLEWAHPRKVGLATRLRRAVRLGAWSGMEGHGEFC